MSLIQLAWLNLPKWIGADGVLVCARVPRILEPTGDPEGPIGRLNVLKIVLGAFPEPDESTSWEQIIEFRSDPDSAGQVLALRR